MCNYAAGGGLLQDADLIPVATSMIKGEVQLTATLHTNTLSDLTARD